MNSIIRSYIFLVVSLGLSIAGVYYFALAPMERHLAETIHETAQTHLKLADYQKTMIAINEYLLRKRELQSQRDFLTARLYNKKEVLALVEHLKTNAQRKDLRVKEISPSVSELLALNSLPPEDGAPRFLDIAMRYTGSFRDAGEFLATLESEPIFVDLLSFDIISREGGLVPAEFRVRFSSIVGGVSDAESDDEQ